MRHFHNTFIIVISIKNSDNNDYDNCVIKNDVNNI